MNKEQLEEELKVLEDEHIKAKKAVIRKFIILNNPYKVGDIVQDHSSVIKVEEIQYDLRSRCAVYIGPKLKKHNHEPYKNGDRDRVWQCNILKK